MKSAEFYSWHFMPWPYLPADFDERYDSGWVTVPNSLFDRDKARGLYQEYIAEMVYADELGFDGLVLNEHHQNIYGLMPSPNLIAAALSQRTSRARIVVLGNLLPLALRPQRVAEEYAMLDQMTQGRIVAGFALGGGQELFNYNVSPPRAREQYWEAIDLIVRAWTDDGPFSHDGKHYPTRYVNVWPKPLPAPASAHLDPRRAQRRDHDRGRPARVHLLPVHAHASVRVHAGRPALRHAHRGARRPLPPLPDGVSPHRVRGGDRRGGAPGERGSGLLLPRGIAARAISGAPAAC